MGFKKYRFLIKMINPSVVVLFLFSIFLFQHNVLFSDVSCNSEILRLIRKARNYPLYEGDIFSVGPYSLYDFYPAGFLKNELSPEGIRQGKVLFGKSFGQVKEIAERLREENKTLKISVIFSNYNTLRIQNPEKTGNQLSIDALRKKIAQLNELLGDYSDVIEWELVVVDSTPHSRGVEVVKNIVNEQVSKNIIKESQVKVLAIPNAEGKGGAITDGIRELLEPNSADIFIYTDDDTSTDLREIGLLIGPMLSSSDKITIGSTKVEGSVRVDYPGVEDPKIEQLDNAMKEVYKPLNHKFLLTPLTVTESIKDTQRGFKAYSKKALKDILPEAQEREFAFDTELMLIGMNKGYHIKEEPIFWVDAPGSASTNSKVRWNMILRFIEQYERIVRDQMGIKTLTDEQLQFLKSYANEALEVVDKESLDEQIERWNKLAQIIQNW